MGFIDLSEIVKAVNSNYLCRLLYFLGRALENEDYTGAQLLIKLCLTIIDTSHFDSKMETKRLEKL